MPRPTSRTCWSRSTPCSRRLTALGFAPVAVPLTLDLEAVRQRLLHLRPAFVFNLVESVDGQGRLIHLAPALYEFAGPALYGRRQRGDVPDLQQAAGQAAAWRPPASPRRRGSSRRRKGCRCPTFPGPYIVKSVWEHASIGIDESSVVDDARKVAAVARKRQRRFGGEWFAERFIDGREFNLSLLGGPRWGRAAAAGGDAVRRLSRRASGASSTMPRSGMPARSSSATPCAASSSTRPTGSLLARLEEMAQDAAGGCSGSAAMPGSTAASMPSGRPWVLEVNVNPCLSPDAGFAAAAARAGLDLAAVAAAHRRGVAGPDRRTDERQAGAGMAAAVPQAMPR